MRRRVLVVLLVGAASACASAAPDPPVHVEDSCAPVASGVVRSAGMDGPAVPVLSGDRGGLFFLSGEGVAELGRLSGGRVEVCGRVEATDSAESAGRIVVRSFRLLEMDGRPAHLGVLTRRDDAWALELCGSASTLPLRAVPGRLRQLAGSLVWITGRDDPTGWEVTSFGLVTEAPGDCGGS